MIAAALLSLAVPSFAPASEQALMRQWYRENELCRGSSDEAVAGAACRKRDATGEMLERKGWCWAYSDTSVLPSEYAWHRCNEARPPKVTFGDVEGSNVTGPAPGDKGPVFALVLIVIMGLFYMLPSIVAASRRHRNMPAIAVLNILLGWTFIGWVGALVWALLRDAPRD